MSFLVDLFGTKEEFKESMKTVNQEVYDNNLKGISLEGIKIPFLGGRTFQKTGGVFFNGLTGGIATFLAVPVTLLIDGIFNIDFSFDLLFLFASIFFLSIVIYKSWKDLFSSWTMVRQLVEMFIVFSIINIGLYFHIFSNLLK